MFDVKKYFNDLRKNRHKYDIYRNKFIKKKIREYQRNHNGKHPNLKLIPSGPYCHGPITVIAQADSTPPIFKYEKPCPFYESIEVSDPDDYKKNPGIVAAGQTWIGCCKFLCITDNELDGSGLLWDECKECSINMEEK